MPVPNYSVLKGTPISGKEAAGNSPHYQVTVNAGGSTFTIAVNIQSTDGSQVLYVEKPGFTPPDPQGLIALSPGITPLPSSSGGLALDYVREQINGAPMVQRSEMTLLPTPGRSSTGSPLNDAVVSLVQQAIAGHGLIYAFGSSYADSGRTDGIHNIHMNQGNPSGSFARDNGIWQDGGLMTYLPAQAAWTALFLAFQTESWNTGNTGNPV